MPLSSDSPHSTSVDVTCTKYTTVYLQQANRLLSQLILHNFFKLQLTGYTGLSKLKHMSIFSTIISNLSGRSVDNGQFVMP